MERWILIFIYLTPYASDSKLEVGYETETEPEFEFVSDTENFTDSEAEVEEKGADGDVPMEEATRSSSQLILLYVENFQDADMNVDADGKAARKLPTVTPPRVIQAPYNIPPLYPFIRTNVFFLMDPHSEKIPKSLKFSATSNDGVFISRIMKLAMNISSVLVLILGLTTRRILTMRSSRRRSVQEFCNLAGGRVTTS